MRGVIFDLDGTLVDSLQDIAAALNYALAALGWPTHAVEVVESFVGDGARILVRRALPEADPRAEDEVLAAFRSRYATHALVHTRPYPGIEATLATLHAKRIPMAVLSNKPDDATRAIVAALFETPFVAVRGERVGCPRKPDPRAALEIAAQMQCSPNELLFVGDTPIDIATAHAAGMQPIAVSWGMRQDAELGGAEMIRDPDELLRLV